MAFHHIRRAVIGIIMVLLAAVVGCDPGVEWTHVNQTGFPIELFILPDTGADLCPNQTRSFLDLDIEKSETYVVKAYIFVPGDGNVAGWDANCNRVTGHTGDLFYCKVYSRKAFTALKRRIVVPNDAATILEWNQPETPSCPGPR